MRIPLLSASLTGAVLIALGIPLRAQNPTLTIDLQRPGPAVSPMLNGLMTEEINHSYDGGNYGELIRNRVFKDDNRGPASWSVVQAAGGNAGISLDQTQAIEATALTTCLKLKAPDASAAEPAGIANGGYWGIPVRPGATYRASFLAKSDSPTTGPLEVAIQSDDGNTTFATARVAGVSDSWHEYAVTLTTAAGVTPSATNRFVILTSSPGTYWFNLVSLFPPTTANRPNGFRPDLIDMLRGMNPRFLRLPGGNFLEGNRISERFPWKETLGPIYQRPGHPGCWGYRASDGMGLLEFLEWTEDIHAQPLLAVYDGMSLPKPWAAGEMIPPGDGLQPYIDDALNEIEYVIGGVNTTWGARRIADGHPAPFPLTCVEIGNEDWFDKTGTYDARFTQFYDAIHARYPQLRLISTIGSEAEKLGVPSQRAPLRVHSRNPDAVDEHYYWTADEFEAVASDYFEKYDRNGPKVFVGEWASHTGNSNSSRNAPTPNMECALGDAAWLTDIERNSDLVVMQCYAPLFVNVSPGARQWTPDLIGYDALNSYGSPSYYVQKMFSQYLGDSIVPVASAGVPTRQWQPAPGRGQAAMAARQVPTLFYDATRNSGSGDVFLKVVNTAATPQAVDIRVNNAKVAADGTLCALSASGPEETNTISDPNHVVPATSPVSGLGASFSQTFAPYSVNVLVLHAR